MGTENEEFKKSSFYVEPGMFEDHDKVFYRDATGYLSWIQCAYGDKWTEHIGNIKYGDIRIY